MERWERISVGVLLAVFTVEGAARFYLQGAGLPQAIYVKDLLALLVCAAAGVRQLVGKAVNPAYVLVFCFLTVYTLFGLLRGTQPIEVLFGAKAFLPLLLGTAAFPLLFSRGMQRYLLFLWFVAAVGLYLDYLFDVPWSGLTYEVGELEVRAAKQWNATGGFERLAGFSRSSVDLASQLVFFWLAGFGPRGPLVKTVAWAVSSVAIFFTTMKGLLMSFTAIGLASLLLQFRVGRSICKVGAYALPLFVVGLPLLSGPAISSQLFHGNLGPLSLSSFGERLRDMWPNQFEALAHFDLPWLGVGFGFVGAPATVFRGEVLPGDNIFVYLYFIMGVLSVAPLFSIAAGVGKLASALDRSGKLFFLVGFSILVNGITANVFENACSCLFLGCLAGYLMQPQREGAFAPVAAPNRLPHGEAPV